MSSVSSNHEESHDNPRKRVRKGTSSCWECKRRKVRCQFGPDNNPICIGCVSRGTTCISQEFPADHIPPRGTQIGERLGRVEALLQKLVQKVDAFEPGQIHDGGGDSPEANDYGYSIHEEGTGDGLVLDLLDRVVGNNREVKIQTKAPGVSQGTTPGSALSSRMSAKLERLRKTLVGLLPTQQDVHLICTASNAWALVKALCSPIDDIFQNHDPMSFFNLNEISKRHPTIIARTILYICLCIQQLPPEFPSSSLSLGAKLDTMLHKYTSTVSDLVLGDDELVGSMEGIECLLLLSFYHINAGNLRRAWLPCRKALTVAQMKGFHKDLKKIPRSTDPMMAMMGKRMWYQIINLDRYLAIILGLPVGSKDDRFDPDETPSNPSADQDDIFRRRLCIIAGAIVDRNEDDCGNKFVTTQEIDERLDSLRNEMREGFWDIPTLIEAPRSALANMQFDRLIHQMWFFQLEGLLHLPFMLRAATEHRYEYNKFTCLKASRELIVRYLALRQVSTTTICCRVADFGGFVAAVILVLDLISSPPRNESKESRNQREEHRGLVQDLLLCLETVARNPREVVAAQSIVALKTMLAENGGSSGRTRLSIPYLGTITIVQRKKGDLQRKQSLPYVDKAPMLATKSQDRVTANQQYDPGFNPQSWSNLNFINNVEAAPVVSFTSSHFVADLVPPEMDMVWTEGDSFFFDSLLSTDLGGVESVDTL